VRQPIGERIMLHGRRLGTHLGVDLRPTRIADVEAAAEREAMMDWIAVPASSPPIDEPRCRNLITRATPVAHCDQGGRPDGVQIMVHRGTPISGTCFRKGSA
jgi:hypothetical protein